jgi:ABC-type phosphate transport system substrate-binding protein
MMRVHILRAAAACALIGVLLSCPTRVTRADSVTLTIAGAGDVAVSLVAPMVARYESSHPGIAFHVYPTTSEEGIRGACQPWAFHYSIGISDSYLYGSQISTSVQSPGGGPSQGDCSDLIDIPIGLSSAPVVYNLPGAYFNARAADGVTLLHPLRLTAQIVASIYLGAITQWNDRTIAGLNPGAPLPAQPIRALHDTEPNGVGSVFSEWLARSDPRWQGKVGITPDPKWPGRASPQYYSIGKVSQAVEYTPYTLGYTTLAGVEERKLQGAALLNAGGKYVAPLASGAVAAARGALIAGFPSDFRRSFVLSTDPAAFDPSYFVYFIVNRDLRRQSSDAATRTAIKDFLTWAVSASGGQANGSPGIATGASSAASPRAFIAVSCSSGSVGASTSGPAVPCEFGSAAQALVATMTS